MQASLFSSRDFREFEKLRDEVFSVDWKYDEGMLIELSPGEKIVVAEVKGPARLLLLGERPALNMMSRASGIATRFEILSMVV